MVEAGKDIESAYWELVVKDIQDACKLLEPIYNEKDGEDGNVSVMVSPKLANDTKGTIEAAKKLHKMTINPAKGTCANFLRRGTPVIFLKFSFII